MKKNLLALIVFPFIITSCVVSKKKYEELEYAKRRSDAKVAAFGKKNKQLNSKLDRTIAEYNDMKNSMAESNAKKNTEIDELSTELMGLASDTTNLKTRLQETLQKYDDLLDQIAGNEIRISALLKEIDELKADSTKLAQDLNTAQVESEWDEKQQLSSKQKAKGAIAEKDNEIESLKEQIEEKDGKLSWLRKVKTKNEEEIERLTNQVKLYKTEYEKATAK